MIGSGPGMLCSEVPYEFVGMSTSGRVVTECCMSLMRVKLNRLFMDLRNLVIGRLFSMNWVSSGLAAYLLLVGKTWTDLPHGPMALSRPYVDRRMSPDSTAMDMCPLMCPWTWLTEMIGPLLGPREISTYALPCDDSCSYEANLVSRITLETILLLNELVTMDYSFE